MIKRVCFSFVGSTEIEYVSFAKFPIVKTPNIATEIPTRDAITPNITNL